MCRRVLTDSCLHSYSCLASVARQAVGTTLVGKYGWDLWLCGQAGRFASLSTYPRQPPTYPSSKSSTAFAHGLFLFLSEVTKSDGLIFPFNDGRNHEKFFSWTFARQQLVELIMTAKGRFRSWFAPAVQRLQPITSARFPDFHRDNLPDPLTPFLSLVCNYVEAASGSTRHSFRRFSTISSIS